MTDPLATIRTRRKEIAAEIAKLSAEDEDLATAEAVLARLDSGRPMSSSSGGRIQKPASPEPRSQRECVVAVLRGSRAAWLKSGEIIDEVQRLWGRDISARSMRPLLSFMKRDQIIVRRGRLVALRERAREARGASRTDF